MSKTITDLQADRTPNHASQVRKGKGKTILYLNYFNGKITIRNSYGEMKKIITGKDKSELIEKLNKEGYVRI